MGKTRLTTKFLFLNGRNTEIGLQESLSGDKVVRVKIIGHTDSDGDTNANLILSLKRALAIKNALLNFYGINAARMETDCKGESQPVQSNNTTLGKAQYRRVEFVRL